MRSLNRISLRRGKPKIRVTILNHYNALVIPDTEAVGKIRLGKW